MGSGTRAGTAGGCTPAAYERFPGQPGGHAGAAGPAADLGGQFCRRLWRICSIVNTAPAALLVVMSLLEALVISFIGTISSRFYQVFVDRQQLALLHLMLWSAGCYAATALFFSAKESLKELFAWRWRARLTLHLQDAYCSNLAFFKLQGCDTPDQRLAQDLPQLTASLADTIAVLAAVPFNVVWYSVLTHRVFGSWVPVASAGLFFLAGLLLQRLAMMPVATAVFRREAAEGGYRYQQMRLRAWAAEIALCRSAPVEQHHLEQQLSAVLVAQGRLVLQRAALTAVTKALEYGGLIVNFGCLAAAVFGGAWDQAGHAPSAGDTAAKVSVASFYLLTLINSFTQVLDLADKVSSLAGLTARVSQLLEEVTGRPSDEPQQQLLAPAKLPVHRQATPGRRGQHWHHQQQQEREQQAHGQQQHRQQQLRLLGEGTAPSHARFASQAVLLQAPQLVRVGLPQLDGPANARHGQQSLLSGDQVMQVSIHSLGSDVLLREVRGAFPQSPHLAPLLAVVTFQFCGSARQLMLARLQRQQQQQQQQLLLQPAALAAQGSSSEGAVEDEPCCSPCAAAAADGDSSSGCSGCLCSEAEMAAMLEVFLHWQQVVCDTIRSRCYWADAIDPRSGRALHGPPGNTGYDEVIGAAVLLGYQKQQLGLQEQQLLLRRSLEQQQLLRRSLEQHQQQPQGAQQTFALVKHPEAGTKVYPATLFTSAPLPVVREALRAAAGQPAGSSGSGALSPLLATGGPWSPQPAAGAAAAAAAAGGGSGLACRARSLPEALQLLPSPPAQPCTRGFPVWQHPQQDPQPQLLLSCTGLSVDTPAGVPVVRELTLNFTAGGSLLIRGPSGSGKSTLVRCLAGLWAPRAGRANLGAAAGAAATAAAGGGVWPGPGGCSGSGSGAASGRPAVMFVPQRALAAPGQTLRDQLVYPAAAAAWHCSCNSSVSGSSSMPRPQQERSVRRPPVRRSLAWQQQEEQQEEQQQALLLPVASAGRGAAAEARAQQQLVRRPAWRWWWHNWLSCGLLQKHHAAQQQADGTCTAGQRQQPCSGCCQLLSVLQAAGLSYLLPLLPAGLATVAEDWGVLLSPGELQRLAVARLLLHRPLLAVLDEGTASLPDAEAAGLYAALAAAGVSVVSVGHAGSLVGLHRQVLSIAGDGLGSWELQGGGGGESAGEQQ